MQRFVATLDFLHGVPSLALAKFSPEVVAKVLSELRAGRSMRQAARTAGVSHVRLYGWLLASKRGKPPYSGLHQAVDDAVRAHQLSVQQKVSEQYRMTAAA